MRSKATLLVAAAAALVLTGPASATLPELIGNWKNINPATRDLVRVEITDAGGAINVHAWGACSPNPCDLGTVKAVPFAPDVSAPLPADGQYLQAEFPESFAAKTLIIGPAPTPGGELTTLFLTRFTDNSGRSAYAAVDKFKK
jgi:hypothetical protein